jgi:hypothetical protein
MLSDKDQLNALYKHCHGVVRSLKIGDTGAISCTKEFSATDIKHYMVGYAFFKHKWFEVNHDAVANVINAKRVVVPSFLPPQEPDEFEEQ